MSRVHLYLDNFELWTRDIFAEYIYANKWRHNTLHHKIVPPGAGVIRLRGSVMTTQCELKQASGQFHDDVIKWINEIIAHCTYIRHSHDDVIKWKHFLRYWTFVREIHRSPVNSPHKGQWCGALMFSLICAWANNREAGDLRRHHAHYDVTVMCSVPPCPYIGSLAPWWFECNLDKSFLIYFELLMAEVSLVKFPSDECHWTLLMISKRWLR